MDLIYTNANREDIGVLRDYELDLAFGADENNFECRIQAQSHCCEDGSLLYIEGTEYGGIVDSVGSITEDKEVIYSGRTWHGILASKVIVPLKKGEKSPTQGRLPEGYKELEYIESSGTQYINTGYVPNDNTSVAMDFQLVNVGTGNQALFAVAGQFSFRWIGSGAKFRSNGADSAEFPTSISGTDRHVVLKSATICVLDNTYSVENTVGTVTYPLYLLAQNAGTSVTFPASARLFACQIVENGAMVRDFVPCKNPSNVVGLYDIVNDVFYKNSGSGTFTAGAEIEEPEDSGDVANVTIKLKDSDGSSLVDKYLVIGGDANQCILHIINRCNLSSFFTISEDASQISVDEYQFHRFTDAYSGLMKMCESVGAKLRFAFDGSKVVLSAIKAVDYSKDEEFDSDVIDFEITKQYNTVNHLICLGSGELENRLVVHLYADADGKISQTQTFFGLDEYSAIYDYSVVESEEELIKEGKKRFKELRTDSISLNINETEDLYDVGDIIGATDNVTGIFVSDAIKKKIVTIKNGQITINYKVGE